MLHRHMTSRFDQLAWFLLLPALLVTSTAMAADPVPETILLWENGAPQAVGTEEADKPLLWVVAPPVDQRNGAAVVICPGGGYGMVAVDHEGQQVAKFLNTIGVTAFVLKYRLAPRYRHPAPMQDVQRALKLVRARAAEWKLAPERLGVVGFSAGGHLASTAATHFADAQPEAADPIERVSSRPNFAVLAYPVITMTQPFGHGGSKRNLLGDNPDPALAALMSNELQVTPQTPPTFLFHTGEDDGVPVENSLAFYAALRKHKVPAELHVYQFGPHGVGLAPGNESLFTWKDRLADWLRDSGFLSDTERAEVTGTIKLDGEPLKWGQIAFVPGSPHEPQGFAMIHNGNYSMPASRGPALGMAQVRLTNQGNIVSYPTQPDAVMLATDYLWMKIEAGKNTFELSLQSPNATAPVAAPSQP